MDFTLTDDQVLLRDTARTLLAKECPTTLLRAHLDDPAAADPLWAHLREYTALATGPLTDLTVFLQETGYVAAPGPFFPTVALAAPVLAALGAPAADALDAVLAGERRATLAIAGRDGVWLPNADGTKTFVLDADRADLVVVVDRGAGGPAARLVEGPLLDAQPVHTVDSTRRVFEVDAAALGGDALPLDAAALARALERAYVALAADMVGTARRTFDMSLQYAKERVQFDRPIGSFQAIQHKLADMGLALERSSAAVAYAAMCADAGDADATRAAHVAKAAAGEAARRILKDGMQIHGGIGYTWEHDLQLFLRRAIASEHLLGTTGWHHDRLAELLFV